MEYKSPGIGLLYSLMEEIYPGAFKSAGIGFLHSIMGETYLGTFECIGIGFTPFPYGVYLSQHFEKHWTRDFS